MFPFVPSGDCHHIYTKLVIKLDCGAKVWEFVIMKLILLRRGKKADLEELCLTIFNKKESCRIPPILSLHTKWDTSWRLWNGDWEWSRWFNVTQILHCCLCCVCSSRVFVKHHSPQLLPVPGHLVCKRYEIFSPRVTQNDVWETERRQNEDKGSAR